jgi:hypothetical protein
MPTNVFFSPKVRTEQHLYEDLVIEALRMYGQDVYYIPRETVTPDEILNEEYSKYANAYTVEMYVANTESFEGDGNLLSKFGLEICDTATFVVARRRFRQLVEIDANSIHAERPREGDLVYLPMSKSLFEIKFVEHEKPFYQLNNLPTYELQCELFEYSAEKFSTGVKELDSYEHLFGPQNVIQITGGTYGFKPGDKVKQIINPTSQLAVTGEVANFIETRAMNGNIARQGNLYVTDVQLSDGSLGNFINGSNILNAISNANTGWSVTKVYGLDDKDMYIPQEPLSQNEIFESKADDIIDFSETNPFGDPRTN